MYREEVAEAILDRDTEALRELFASMDKENFALWYRGMLAFYDACHWHINEFGLEHLVDEYEC